MVIRKAGYYVRSVLGRICREKTAGLLDSAVKGVRGGLESAAQRGGRFYSEHEKAIKNTAGGLGIGGVGATLFSLGRKGFKIEKKLDDLEEAKKRKAEFEERQREAYESMLRSSRAARMCRLIRNRFQPSGN